MREICVVERVRLEPRTVPYGSDLQDVLNYRPFYVLENYFLILQAWTYFGLCVSVIVFPFIAVRVSEHHPACEIEECHEESLHRVKSTKKIPLDIDTLLNYRVHHQIDVVICCDQFQRSASEPPTVSDLNGIRWRRRNVYSAKRKNA